MVGIKINIRDDIRKLIELELKNMLKCEKTYMSWNADGLSMHKEVFLPAVEIKKRQDAERRRVLRCAWRNKAKTGRSR